MKERIYELRPTTAAKEQSATATTLTTRTDFLIGGIKTLPSSNQRPTSLRPETQVSETNFVKITAVFNLRTKRC
jgi:hypothetical protein